MSRERTLIPASYWQEQPRWIKQYNLVWSGVIGDRVRRLRRGADLTLWEVADRLIRPDGTKYSASYFSRLERGSSSSPFYVYIALAHAFGLHPGRLMGVDDAERDASAEEMTLIRFLRRAGVTPDDALQRLAGMAPSEQTTSLAEPPLPTPVELPEVEPRPPVQEPGLRRRDLLKADFGIED